jgi:nickel/cobalt transporter (NicO) family protein
MRELLFFLVSSFWAGAAHAATPGHGKTIAAAYIVGARGKPIDAVILGIFVTLSHTSGILIMGGLAAYGVSWLRPQSLAAYLSLALGLLVVALGTWMLWTQKGLLRLAMDEPPDGAQWSVGRPTTGEASGGHQHSHVGRAKGHGDAVHPHHHDASHSHDAEAGWHSHGWGKAHAHRLDLVVDQRPKLSVLLTLGLVGGLLPDPAALALLLAALSSGQVLLGLVTVAVFSLGFAATLVVVGIAAAKVGQAVLEWLGSIWMVRAQIATTLLIFGMGIVLTIKAASEIADLPS